MPLDKTYVSYVFAFLFQTVKSLSSNIEALKKEVELAAMAAKSKESPSQARQIVSTNCSVNNNGK